MPGRASFSDHARTLHLGWTMAATQRTRLIVLTVGALAASTSLVLVAHSCSSAGNDAQAPSPGPAVFPSQEAVRVLLSGPSGKGAVTVSVAGPVVVDPLGFAQAMTRPLEGDLGLRREGASIAGPGFPACRALRLTALAGGRIDLDGRSYQGTITFAPGKTADTLAVVNAVPLETYLLGVVGGEMPPSWPLEALKAQAVAARTYAVSRCLQARASGRSFDLYDDTRSQVYVGVPDGRWEKRLSEAISGTAGEILFWQGDVVPAFFHSTCGGHTEPAMQMFASHDIGPLQGVPCTGCSDSPRYRWEVRLARKDIEDKLACPGIESIEGVGAGPSGRPRQVRIASRDGERVLTASRFRRAIGTRVLKSSAFVFSWVPGPESGTTRPEPPETDPPGPENPPTPQPGERPGAKPDPPPDGLDIGVFEGRGFGHGVGLCQWGARGMATSGAGYVKILRHYYPGAELLPAGAVLGGGPP